MFNRTLVLSCLVAWLSLASVTAAQPAYDAPPPPPAYNSAPTQAPTRFGTLRLAVSLERFMGVSWAKHGDSEFRGRLLLNASEYVPTDSARIGIDVFIKQVSLGVAGGTTFGSNSVSIIAPRAGYFLSLERDIGLWIRGGVFFADYDTGYFGVYAEGLLHWFPYENIALSLGPTFDFGSARGSHHDSFVSIGLLQFGLTAFL